MRLTCCLRCACCRACCLPLPLVQALPLPGGDGLLLRSGCDELSELRRDALERDEKRLAELGRRTVEMFALAHIVTDSLEVRCSRLALRGGVHTRAVHVHRPCEQPHTRECSSCRRRTAAAC